MSASTRQALLQTLGELSEVLPSMRLGQIVNLLAGRAGDDERADLRLATDEALVRAGQDYARTRRANHATGGQLAAQPLTPGRQQLLQALAEIGCRFPEPSLGQLVANAAAITHTSVYDVEDEQLIEAIRSFDAGVRWFEWYAEQLRSQSTVCPSRPGQRYACPCCGNRTLGDRGGFEICPVCYWEDDGQDDADADTVRYGPNGVFSLTRARENFRRFGVYDPKYIEHVRPPRPEELPASSVMNGERQE